MDLQNKSRILGGNPFRRGGIPSSVCGLLRDNSGSHSMNFDIDTDNLIQLAASGDDQAKLDLLSRHRERLKCMVTLRMDDRLRARFDASDVVQEALITIHKRLPDYLNDAGRISFYPWIRKITWEHLLKLNEFHLQTLKRSVNREAKQQAAINDESVLVLVNRLASNVSSPSAGMLRAELRERIQSALAALKSRDREILELIYLEQLSPQEVSDVLSLSRQAMSMRHLRALKRLSDLLINGSSES